MATIYIDGKAYQVEEKKNLLDAIISLGLNLPYFCWHPAMGSVGACRQCAIKMFKDENDTQGKITMACMEPITDGVRISIKDPEAKELRSNVIEWLMTNHPHDCPICDEGGECHLQDMTVMTGHNYRRHRYNKRTYRNQYLGPFINHEMNRCIQCYRCVRFYREYAGGRDLNSFAAHNHVYFGRHEDGVLENEFSGNLVEVCPTGVFTDKTLKRHYTRKWDLTTAPSVCHQCGLGCNTIAGERYGTLRRILSRYNGKVNGYFLCDRGRFGYEFVNSDKRIREPLRRGDASGNLEPVDHETLQNHLNKILSNNEKVIGIGSPRASLESNFALRTLVGENRFYHGVSDKEYQLTKTAVDILKNGPARTPSMKEVEKADAVLILGEDLTNTAPMLALAIRQAGRQIQIEIADKLGIPDWHDAAVREAAQDQHGPLFISTTDKTKLDDIASRTHRAVPQDTARLGFAVAGILNNQAPKVNDLPKEVQELSQEIAQTLKKAERPLIVSGTSCGDESLLKAAANVAWALSDGEKQAELCFTFPEANSMGLSLMGGGNLQQAVHTVEKGEADTVIVLENDLYRRNDKQIIDQLVNSSKHLIVLDYLENQTTEKAEVVIPVGTFAEADGTIVNNEGRAQRFYQVFVPEGEVQESWRWLRDIMAGAGRVEMDDWNILDDYTKALTAALPVFTGIQDVAPPPGYRAAGQKIPRQPHRYSGRTAMLAHKNVNEPKPPDDPDSALSFTMEGYRGEPPSSLIPFFWSPGWNSAQSINKYQIEVGGPLHGGDPGIRLIEPASTTQKSFFSEIPEPFESRKGEWLLIPTHHIFGSDELSTHTPALAERMPSPYLMVNKEDAAHLSVEDGQEITLTLNGGAIQLPVKTSSDLPRGAAAYPVGLPGLSTVTLPKWGKISEAGK